MKRQNNNNNNKIKCNKSILLNSGFPCNDSRLAIESTWFRGLLPVMPIGDNSVV